MFITLASKSLLNRKGSVALTLLAMSVSIFVLLGVEHIRHQTKASFNNTVSGVDLIVGAKTGSLNLLLYSVFRIGNPTNNISWHSYQRIKADPSVAWSVPISLGDSHKGYRVMGTSQDYFKHFSYANKQALQFASGAPFNQVLDVVLGAEVARKLDYKLGDKLVLAHGMAKTSFSLHDDAPFTVVGILKPTGTPVDQTLHVDLAGLEAIHQNWQQGVKVTRQQQDISALHAQSLTPNSITAMMVGLNSRLATFKVQRAINNDRHEPLLAILPGVALAELWQMMNILESTLRLITLLILTASLLGLSAMLLASIRERKHEIQLLRVIGAPPLYLFMLIELEAVLITLISMVVGAGLLYVGLSLASDYLIALFGLHINNQIFSSGNLQLLLLMMLATLVAAAIPSFSAYRNAKQSLHH